MNSEEYKKIINKTLPKENRVKDAFLAFFVGGLYGFFTQLLSDFFTVYFNITCETSYMIVTLIVIFLTALLTGLGVFDDIVKVFKCAFIVPTTGFAHSVASTILDNKRDGIINGVGSNCFKLAGSVIFYGIVSAFFLCLIKVVILGG